MSLIIQFIKMEDFEIEDPNNGLFGFEIWRKTLWGNSIIKKVGCEIIPKLKNSDIFAVENDLLKLKEDLLIIKKSVNEISIICEIDVEAILLRINNALEFIKIAEKEKKIIGIYIG